MLKTVVIFFLVWGSAAMACKADDIPIDVKQIRKQLILAVDRQETTDSLYKGLKSLHEKTPLVVGYIATLEALKAKHAWNPYHKLQFLNDSRKTFQKAISADTANIEIRFMRFSVQHNLPGFLGQSKNMDEDRISIIAQLGKKNYVTADQQLTKTIIGFLLNSKRCTAIEIEELETQLSAMK